jgi:hypothetical protein
MPQRRPPVKRLIPMPAGLSRRGPREQRADTI